jgi:signal transduction histidine kinase
VSYDQSDGLPNLEVSGKFSQPAMCRTRDGRLWIATAGGVAILDPKDLPDSTNAPLVVIEQVRANGQIIFDNGPPALLDKPGLPAAHRPPQAQRAPSHNSKSKIANLKSKMSLPPGSARVLEFEYTANTVIAPEAARFKYFLEGWDKEWIDGGAARKAYYANLHPGDYRFHVLAADKCGLWSETEATAFLHLAPFFYETSWFRGLCGAVIASGTYFGIAFRLRKTRQIAGLERQIALDNQRKRIARDIHDELGASLTQIAQLSEDAPEFRDQAGLAGDHTRRIAELAEEAVGNIGEIVWANNPRYDKLQDLVAYLREYTANYLGAAAIESHLVFPEEVPDRDVTGPLRRYQLAILKEALHNVVKHSGATRVEVILVLNPTDLQLTVRDNGVGIGPANEHRFGNGLVNIKERSSELGGVCEIASQPGQGTTLRVRLPLPKLASE